MASGSYYCLEAIQQNSDLSSVYSYINTSASFSDLLNSTSAFTFLAPTNQAIEEWNSSQENLSQAVIDSTLQYHLLNVSFPSVSLTTQPQFVQSYLTNSSYSNVTISPEGQIVGLIKDANGSLNVLSGNLTVSSVTSKFLSLDENQLLEFISNASYTPNMKFFVPNTRAALTRFTDVLSVNVTVEELGSFYKYHMFSNTVAYSSSLTNGTTLMSEQGTNVTITINGSDIYVNSARVISRDYLTVNGVLHVIDSYVPSILPAFEN
ncbi:hypothetical protein IFR05_010188 [Cadophora sp. M221]|nr:hypothetical protein IFR05_010188 [Cadophora sp. M221]